MNESNEILKYCPNYYYIVNFDFNENDIISDKLLTIYKNYIFSIDVQNPEDLQKAEDLDRILASYINDYLFRSTLQKEILTVRVQRDNFIRNLVDAIIKIFSNYEEYTTRKIYISKWI